MGSRIARWLVCAAGLLAGAAAPVVARAGETDVAAPRLESPAEIAYPSGASGDASVVLLLTVAKDGGVRDVVVVSGDEPFASAAKRAVEALRFVPATRAGLAIAARIRFRADFHEPKQAEAKPPAPAPQAAPTPPSAATAPLEVTVRAEKPAPAAVSLSRAEVRQIPGTFGDPFRAIEVLPGVTPVVSGLPYFYVRGAPPGNIGYFLDGVRVPYLYHVAIGPSVVNPAMVDKVELHPGGYPAQFGRYAGAIVSAETTAPRTDWHGEGNLRVFDVGAMVEGGFADGRGTVLVGGRYSYAAALFSLLTPGTKLDYRDFQARITYDLTPRDRIGVFAFGSYDLLAQVKNGITSVAFGSEFYRVDARYDRKLGDEGQLRWAATWGFDQTRVGEQRNARDVLFGTRVTLHQPLGPALTLRAGADAQFDSYTADKTRWADPDDPNTRTLDGLFPPRFDSTLGAWADLVWKVNSRVEIIPGTRFDLFRSAGASAISADGRLALSVIANKYVRLTNTFGLAHQPPSFLVPLPGLSPGSLSKGLQTSFQASAGVEVTWPEVATATVRLFDDVFLNMSDTLGVTTKDPRYVPAFDLRSLGSAFGLEIFLRRPLTRRLGGFVSYTLSRSSRRRWYGEFPSSADRTHVLNMALAYDIGLGFKVGGRFTVYSGAPKLGFGESDVERDPPFYRIDLRAEKRWTFGTSRWLSIVAEGFNITARKETINGYEVGPIWIPSLGLEGGL
ncbi:TonB family protein / TonB-dependent receptor [Minicystis rosea]|nr:TonB family protein / TonB-dependent receptor [Minicystis rosea]